MLGLASGRPTSLPNGLPPVVLFHIFWQFGKCLVTADGLQFKDSAARGSAGLQAGFAGTIGCAALWQASRITPFAEIAAQRLC